MESESTDSATENEVQPGDSHAKDINTDEEGSVIQPTEESTGVAGGNDVTGENYSTEENGGAEENNVTEENNATEETLLGNETDICLSSEKVLKKLCSDGEEFITNVTVSHAIISAGKHKKVTQERLDRINFVLAKQAQSEEQFKKIMSKWDEADTKVPKKLKNLCLKLKVDCENHLKEKDATISKLRNDFETKHEQFVVMRYQQEEEGRLMSQRIQELIVNLRKAADEQLSSIRFVLEKLRNEAVKSVSVKLKEELAKKEVRDEKYKDYHEDVWKRTHSLRDAKLVAQEGDESFRILLEKDIHNFYLQLKATESIQLLNLDKLKYGLYILQHQVKERKLISCEHKRFNIHAFDQLLILKNRLKKMDSKGEKQHSQQLTEVTKATTKLLDTVKAAKQAHVTQKNVFNEVSNKQEGEIMKLFYQVIKVDAFIYKNFLVLQWETPDLSFLKKEKLPPKEQKAQKWAKFLEEEEILSRQKIPENSISEDDQKITETGSLFYIQHPLNIEKLLEFICSQLSFLIDRKALELSKTIYTSIKTFILSNCMFKEIGVQTCDDLNDFMIHIFNHARALGDSESKWVLSSRDVLTGFQDYLLLQKKKLAPEHMIFEEQPMSDVRKESSFWMPYARIIPPEKEKLWDAVIYALGKHQLTLETLCNLSRKKANLLQEKQELKRLLQKPTEIK